MEYIESVQLPNYKLDSWVYKILSNYSLVDKDGVVIGKLVSRPLSQDQLDLLNAKLNEDITKVKVNIGCQFTKVQVNGLDQLVSYQLPTDNPEVEWLKDIKLVINPYNFHTFNVKYKSVARSILDELVTDLHKRLNW